MIGAFFMMNFITSFLSII